MNRLLSLLLILFSSLCYSQNNNECGTDELMNSFLKDPANLQRHLQLENKIYNNGKGISKKGARATYLLPVVIHIIHNGGPENISDALALKTIDYLNEAYRNTSLYDSTDGVSTTIQFCLAKQDPQGLPTTGINRVQSALTDHDMANDIALKNLIRWDPTRYINIWVVRKICSGGPCNVGGYAYFPSAHGTNIDGIVVLASMMGSSAAATSVLVHESGHYLGLYHTFQGGCTNNNCLTDGDHVCDTPPDNTTAYIACSGTMNSCTTDALSGFTTDQPDMHKNFMDYTPIACMTIFTAGQRDRMYWHIDNVRSSLLSCNSCLNPCTSNITAGFTTSNDTVAIGSTVNFTNNSTGAISYKWLVNGVQVTTQANTSYTFNSLGSFVVRLEVTGTDTNCRAFFTDTIFVHCDAVAKFTASNSNPPTGQAVTFTNLSTGATSYQWFVDGTVKSTTQNFTYTFTQPGSYAVYLIASSARCSDTTNITNFIEAGSPCQILFSYSPRPATTCQDVALKPDTSCKFSSYLWTFCEPQFDTTSIQAKNFPHPGNPSLAGVSFTKAQNGKYYSFYGLYNSTSSPYFYRLDFGTSANNNVPARVAINTPTIVNEERPHGVDIAYFNGQYYGFILFNTTIYRLDFGANIENANPTVTKLSGFSNMGWGHKIEIVHETNNWWLIVAARASSSINIIFLGNNITNNVQSAMSHTVNACSGFSYHKINGTHCIWATSLFDGIKRLNFGNSLANTPVMSAFMKTGPNLHDDISLYQNCDGSLDGIVIKEDNITHALVHFDSINALPKIKSVFYRNIERSAGMCRLIRTDAGLTTLIIQGYASRLAWVNFTDCGIPFSTQQFPTPVRYNTAGTYRVRLAVDEGLPTQQTFCSDITVTGTNPKPLNLGNDTSICVAGVKTLNAGSGYKRYLWQDMSQDSVFSAYGAGKYYVEAEDFCGNIFRDTITITVDSTKRLNLGADTSVCKGGAVELKLNNSFSKYTYNPGNVSGTTCAGCPNPIVHPTSTTIYTITAKTPDGCTTAASINVEVLDCISAVKNTSDTICRGDSIFFVNTWLKDAGIYTDTVSGNPDTIYKLQLTVNIPPIINLGKDTSYCNDILFLEVPDGYNVRWSTGETTNVIGISNRGLYTVSVQDTNGCTSYDSILISLDCEFEMPNVFTPNGDGENDFFYPVLESKNMVVEEFRIYNRWGQLIYNGRKDLKGWDGKYQNTEQPNGCYFYTISVSLPNKAPKFRSGSFTLIR